MVNVCQLFRCIGLTAFIGSAGELSALIKANQSKAVKRLLVTEAKRGALWMSSETKEIHNSKMENGFSELRVCKPSD